MRLSRSHDLGHEFGGLTLVVFYVLFIIDFFVVSYFKVGLIEN